VPADVELEDWFQKLVAAGFATAYVHDRLELPEVG
jgi:hypothetical protein